MDSLTAFLSEHIGIKLWVASLVAIAIVTVALNQLAQVLLRQAAQATRRTSAVWDEALVISARRPMLAAMWLVGAGFMARVVQYQVDFSFLDQALVARDVALIVCVTWFLLRFVGEAGDRIVAGRRARGEELDLTTVDALGKLGRLVVVVLAILTIAQTLDFKITGLLALGGVGGIAVGFAAKDLLANFFGGLTIYLDRPFSVGEWIRSPDKSIEGTVEYISWRHTRVRAFNKNPIYVPNSVFTSIVVENPSRMSHRRIRETIGLRYDDFAVVAPVVADIKAMLRAHDGIDTTQTLIVNFNQFGASSLDILVYCFTKTIVWVQYHEVKQDVLLKIGGIIARHGAEIAFPTHTVHLPDAAESADAPAPSPPGSQAAPA
jgi:MscS family membrane protein